MTDPLTSSENMKEIERLMLEHFKGDGPLYIRWLLRPNPKLDGRKPFHLCEGGRCIEVLALVRAMTDHQKFLNNIGIG